MTTSLYLFHFLITCIKIERVIPLSRHSASWIDLHLHYDTSFPPKGYTFAQYIKYHSIHHKEEGFQPFGSIIIDGEDTFITERIYIDHGTHSLQRGHIHYRPYDGTYVLSVESRRNKNDEFLKSEDKRSRRSDLLRLAEKFVITTPSYFIVSVEPTICDQGEGLWRVNRIQWRDQPKTTTTPLGCLVRRITVDADVMGKIDESIPDERPNPEDRKKDHYVATLSNNFAPAKNQIYELMRKLRVLSQKDTRPGRPVRGKITTMYDADHRRIKMGVLMTYVSSLDAYKLEISVTSSALPFVIYFQSEDPELRNPRLAIFPNKESNSNLRNLRLRKIKKSLLESFRFRIVADIVMNMETGTFVGCDMFGNVFTITITNVDADQDKIERVWHLYMRKQRKPMNYDDVIVFRLKHERMDWKYTGIMIPVRFKKSTRYRLVWWSDDGRGGEYVYDPTEYYIPRPQGLLLAER